MNCDTFSNKLVGSGAGISTFVFSGADDFGIVSVTVNLMLTVSFPAPGALL